MNEENRITLILIDTCAFRDANSDFPGIVKSLLPSFFSTADEKGITLLTHPVLENEIHKHIEDSGIFKDYQSLLTQLRKCTSTLKHYKLDDVLLSSKISELDIQTKLFEAYQQYYQDAIRLDFGDPASVFELYFNSKAPFAMSGKKKAEFPDAFVFDATRKYLEKHPNDILLVISKDSDWTTAFNQIENVIICDSISNALTKISNIDSILSQEMLSQIFRGAYKEIISNAQQNVECECFELDDYENLNELEIESVKIDCVTDSNLNHTGIYLYSKGKIMIHLTFDYKTDEKCTTPGQYLKYHRTFQGLSTRELAEKVGIVPATLVLYENDRHPIKYSTAVALANVLGIDRNRLLDEYTAFVDYPYFSLLKKVRQDLSLTQIQMAELIGIGQTSYSGWEREIRVPRRKEYDKILAALKKLRVNVDTYLCQSASI